ncbi:hypothetical protein AmaxDRAFT_1970 [Limnospira maxima CS-328]|uniref:Uncharacterized protein n=1 Tax=Limnospira maxima CS-328 TaxID=513049 RepID=B5VZG8_LIMMA|nr:hypothetical protein AmaxDRAFT_1970 [Limnospira maxima CS-328]UWU45709.1 hypothetical protein APLC1_0393 [Arthrospira platensis C1]
MTTNPLGATSYRLASRPSSALTPALSQNGRGSKRGLWIQSPSPKMGEGARGGFGFKVHLPKWEREQEGALDSKSISQNGRGSKRGLWIQSPSPKMGEGARGGFGFKVHLPKWEREQEGALDSKSISQNGRGI